MTGLSTAFVALAAICWGVSAGIAAILMGEGWSPFVVSLYRGAVGLACVLLWLAIRPHNSGLGNRQLWFWSAVAGMGVAGNFAFYFYSISQGSVAVAATLMYCAPVFVYLVSFTLKLERPTPLKWAAIALVMFGILLLTQVYNVDADGITLMGVVTGLLAGLFYAIYIFGFKYAAPHGSPQAILVIAFSVFVGILILPSEISQITAVPATQDWPLFLTLGLLGSGLSFVIYIYGLKYTAPAVASIVAMVEPVTASLFGVAILDESLMATQIIGMGLILVTVTALSVYSNRQPLPAKADKAEHNG